MLLPKASTEHSVVMGFGLHAGELVQTPTEVIHLDFYMKLSKIPTEVIPRSSMNINPGAVQKAAITGHYHQATDIFLRHTLPLQEALHLLLTSLQSIFQVLLQEQVRKGEETIHYSAVIQEQS